MGKALWDSGIGQWVERYEIVDRALGDRALGDSRTAEWVEHYGIVG